MKVFHSSCKVYGSENTSAAKYKRWLFHQKREMLKSSRLLVVSEQLKSVLKLTENIASSNYTNVRKPLTQPKTLTTFQSKQKTKVFDSALGTRKLFHTNSVKTATKKQEYEEKEEKAIMTFSDFDKAHNKDKKNFHQLVRVFEANLKNKRGQVEFIRAALKHMKAFGVHKDLETYKQIINVLPKGVYVATTFLMAEGMHYPDQQYVTLDLLCQMEDNCVAPDKELCNIIVQIFGKKAHPAVKCQSMLYWNTKLKYKSPWLLPDKIPRDPCLFGKAAVERITSVDPQTKISVFKAEDVPESIDDTWIVSGQSPTQRELLEKHPPDVPVIVEGGDIVWLDDKYINYFLLKRDVNGPLPYVSPDDPHDISGLNSIYFKPTLNGVKNSPSVHEQDDGVIYAVCVTGTSSKDSLLSWVRLLQQNGNPILGDLAVLFRLKNEDRTPSPVSEELVHQHGMNPPS